MRALYTLGKNIRHRATTGNTKSRNIIFGAVLVALLLVVPSMLGALLKGRVIDPQGNAIANVDVQLLSGGQVVSRTSSDKNGQFGLKTSTRGMLEIRAESLEFRSVTRRIAVQSEINPEITITFSQLASHHEIVKVTADVYEKDVLTPDPGEKVFVRQDLLDANPGRPGASVSIPGYPIETASSGIKAPQYFAPGVAGDHGEPIAQYIAVDNYLVPNNLSANAHGNGYADPNILVPEVLESVQVDGGAFNVREGNHSVNLAGTYGLRSQLDPFLTVTGDYRDINLDRANPATRLRRGGVLILSIHQSRRGFSAKGRTADTAFNDGFTLDSQRIWRLLSLKQSKVSSLPSRMQSSRNLALQSSKLRAELVMRGLGPEKTIQCSSEYRVRPIIRNDEVCCPCGQFCSSRAYSI
jgi:hypothetical protein